MLVITLNLGETINIGDDVTIKLTQIDRVTQIEPEQVKFGIDAPRRIKVHREEIYRRIQGELNRKATVGN